MYNIAVNNPEVLMEAIDGFYDYLDTDPRSKHILSMLTPEEYQYAKDRQREHWTQLVNPHIDSVQLQKSATHVGKIHAILGIPTASIANGGNYFQRKLFDAVHHINIEHQQKQLLIKIIAARIQDETETQLIAMDAYYMQVDELIRHIIQPSQQPIWVDRRQERLTQLTQLDGIAGVLWLGRNHHQECVIEASVMKIDADITDFTSHYLRPTVAAMLDQPKDIEIYNIQLLNLPKEVCPKSIRSLSIRPICDINNIHIGWLVVLGKFPVMFMGNAIKRLIDITTNQLKIDALHQHHIVKGKSELAIHQLKSYLYHGRLAFHYQPIVHIQTGKCNLFEALARLYDHEGKPIPPSEFFPYFGLDEVKFIFIDGLRQAFNQLNIWQQQGHCFEVSINLPPELLIDPMCTHWIKQALHQHQIQPHRLHLELLESEEITNPQQRDHAIYALNQLGVHLKMDDLGAGHSGLIRLKDLPFHSIKIDQHLVRDLETDKAFKVLSILNAILNLANRMQLGSIVEGLETLQEVEVMGVLGAEFAQGYYISRPLPAEQVLPWLSTFSWCINSHHPQTLLAQLVRLLKNIRETLEKDRLSAHQQDCFMDICANHNHLAFQQLHQCIEEGRFIDAYQLTIQLINTTTEIK